MPISQSPECKNLYFCGCAVQFRNLGFTCDLPHHSQPKRADRAHVCPIAMNTKPVKRKHRGIKRTATALIELAICLPLIVFLVGATVEACDLIFLRNTLATASYSGTLEVSRAGCTHSSITNQITQVLNAARIRDFSLTITKLGGGTFASSVKGDLLHIQVSAVSASNLRIGRFIPSAANSIIVQAIAIR